MGVGGYLWSTKKKKKQGSFFIVETDGGGAGLVSMKASCPSPPRTPQEPMEFLSRTSWSLSASEITKALAAKKADGDVVVPPELSQISVADALSFATPILHLQPCTESTPVNRPPSSWRLSSWELGKRSVRKKEKDRAERACVHAALSVAGVAAAVAMVSASGAITYKDEDPKMDTAMASATQLLASHFLDMAERTGVGHDKVATAVRSAVDVRTAGDLLTLTAAAATALRAAAALRQRLQREVPWRMAAVFPAERLHCGPEDVFFREGVLLKLTRKGKLEPKHVKVSLNRRSQVTIEIKSKHAGGAFSTRSTCVVYGVCENATAAWPAGRGREEEGIKAWFGVRTEKGLMEFLCESMIQKMKWVEGIRRLLDQAREMGQTHLDGPLQLMKL